MSSGVPKIVIYEALSLEDLEILEKYFKDKKVAVYSGLYAPSRKIVNKTNTYYEMWSKTLDEASMQSDGAVILGSYWVEYMAIAPSLGMESKLSSEEFTLLTELETELGVEKILVTPGPYTDKEIITRIASSYSKKFPTFSGVEAPKIFGTMMKLEEQGFTVAQLPSIVAGVQTKKKEEGKPLSVERTSDTTMAFHTVGEETPPTDIPPSDVFERLDVANAINDVLRKRIIKKHGAGYECLETEIRVFLKHKLEGLFVPQQTKADQISKDDVELVKTFTKQLRAKMENKK